MEKLNLLKYWFKGKDNVLVAFSGGVDSALLVAVANSVLNEKVLAVTINSPLNSPEETKIARKLAKNLGVNHLVIDLNELEKKEIKTNSPERCYFCKKYRLELLQQIAYQKGFKVIVEGSNIDDLEDYRPGLKAVKELGIRSPLQEVGFNKEQIRKYSKMLNLFVWDKPSEPCLATRIPYGIPITDEKLIRVYEGEKYLKTYLHLNQVRIRDHGQIARIEVKETELEKVIKERKRILSFLRKKGYKFITLDLQGYKRGSMNVLKE